MIRPFPAPASVQRITAVLLAVFALAVCLPGIAATEEHNSSRLAPVLSSIEADPLLRRLYSACPADTFRSQATLFSLLGTEEGLQINQCDTDPGLCLAGCLQGKNAETCFNLARMLQDYGTPAESHHYEPLFALSCAIGRASGCTNRGAGIRNGGYDTDPSKSWNPGTEANCLRRTFKIACDGADAWGCAMYGQALLNGEGGSVDLAGARSAFAKTCDINPDFDACAFARRLTAESDRAAVPERADD